MPDVQTLTAPIQYGALGLCAILTAALVWLIVSVMNTQKQLVNVIADNSRVIAKNTEALENHHVTIKEDVVEVKTKLEHLSNKLHAGECMQRRPVDA
jgi:hypothetical protein